MTKEIENMFSRFSLITLTGLDKICMKAVKFDYKEIKKKNTPMYSVVESEYSV